MFSIRKYIKNARFRMSVQDQFNKAFGVDLLFFWNDRTGFNMAKFDALILHSGSVCRLPVLDVCTEKFGTEAANIIDTLMSKNN